ncbi:MAG: bacteriohemerythrin [Candidatus Kapaibacteriales bacterium]
MALIEWNDKLSVGVPEMDNQHKRLFAIINDLDDAMKQGKGKDVIGKVLSGLETYVHTHFRSEEEFMKKIGFPGLEIQKEEHKKYTDEIEKFHREFKEGKTMLSVQLMNFLRNWLLDHIGKKDKAYGEFASQRK